MSALNGKWHYQSFCPRMDGAPTAGVPPQLAAPWTPAGVLDVTTNPAGNIKGTLTFPSIPGLTILVTGQVTPVMGDVPEGIELTGTVGPAIYRIRGFFVGRGYAVVGTTLSTEADVGRRPVGTQGPFILAPLNAIDNQRPAGAH